MGSPSDLTARARIRDAALTLMAERGIDGASIRDIAQAAGVSSGLLRHHFGSKEGLRDACDEHALHELTSLGTQFTDLLLSDQIKPQVLILQRYVVRSIMDGTPTGDALFDRMVEYGRRWLDTTGIKVSDPDAFVAVLGVMKLGIYTMRDQLTRVMKQDVGEPEGWTRVLLASVEIFAHPLATPEQAERAREALARLVV